MSLYRCAFLFCRALALSLGVSALIDLLFFIPAFVLAVGFRMGMGGISLLQPIAEGGAALLLYAFSKGISATLVGQNTLEGEAIQSSDILMPQEKRLIFAGAGLLLFIPALLATGNGILTGFFTLRSVRSISPWAFLVLPLAASAIKALVGFAMAFGASLRASRLS